MEYKHDVFLSYRRHKEWPKWVSETFYDIFDHWLDAELGHDCSIFVDYQLETGHNWPAALAENLSKSRVLVPLWSPQYFNSEWCLKEMSLFVARENATGFGTVENPQRLIMPAVIHDKDNFPKEAKLIQFKEIQPFCNIRTARGSETLEKLSYEIRNWIPDICKAINHSPPFDPLWKTIAHEQFMELFRKPPANPQMPRL
jgi:hypothetical protein